MMSTESEPKEKPLYTRGTAEIADAIRRAVEGKTTTLQRLPVYTEPAHYPVPAPVRAIYQTERPLQALMDIFTASQKDFILKASMILSFHRGWTKGLVPDLETGGTRPINDTWLSFFFHADQPTFGPEATRLQMGRAYLELILETELDHPSARAIKSLIKARLHHDPF